MWQGRPLGDARPSPQMFGSQDGSVEEHALSSILKTALGVAELTVTHLFRAIDQERKGRITFGEWPRAGEDSPAPPEPGRVGRGSSLLCAVVHCTVRLAGKQTPRRGCCRAEIRAPGNRRGSA